MKITYFILITLFFFVLIWEHDNQGVAYNPLFHVKGGENNAISMKFLCYPQFLKNSI